MEDGSRLRARLVRLAVGVGLLGAAIAGGSFLISRADGPVFVFAGGPLRSGELVGLAAVHLTVRPLRHWPTLRVTLRLRLECILAGGWGLGLLRQQTRRRRGERRRRGVLPWAGRPGRPRSTLRHRAPP